MAQVTFYKSGFNRENRAYNLGALNGVLEGALKCNVGVGNVNILPNVPFAVSSATITSGEVGKSPVKLMTEGYDYISFTTGNVTWYAFIDSIQAIAVGSSTEGLNIFVEHTVDYWATYLANGSLATNFHMHGNVERAHVNDLSHFITIGTRLRANIDMKYTTGATEAPYNKMLVKKNRPAFNNILNRSDIWYLYLYIANPKEVGIGNTDQEWSIGEQTLPVQGIMMCYPVFKMPTNTSTTYMLYSGQYCIVSGSQMSNATDEYLSGEFTFTRLSDLTSSAITSMCLSKIPPVSGMGTDAYYVPLRLLTLTFDGVSIQFPWWANDYLIATDGSSYGADPVRTTFTPAENLPAYAFWFATLNAYTGLSAICDTTGYTPANVRQYITTDYSTYIQNIPKMLSNIYNPVYIADNIIAANTGANDGLSVLNDISICYTPDLKNLCIMFESDYEYAQGATRKLVIPNMSVYKSDVTLDYWTRLNAEQTSISAQQSKFNAISSAVVSTVGAATSVGLAAVSGGMSQAVQIGRAGGATGSLLGVGQSIGNAVYAVQSANNLQRVADQQYNAGETTEFQSTGFYQSLYSKYEMPFEFYTCEEQYDIIAPNLHRYGYNTFLEVDQIYANHQRQAFNYFKGVNVTVGGLPNEWCNSIAEMFNNGVTLWTSTDIGNFEQVNYQIYQPTGDI